MRDKIHPEYTDIEVTCACGQTYQTRSTIKDEKIRVDICASCHPFYTGKQKFVDSAGRVEKFQKKFGGDYFAKSNKK